MKARDGFPPTHAAANGRPSTSAPVRILADGFLCSLHVWSDAEWAVIADTERPIRLRRLEGLGWVGAVPEVGQN